MPVRNTACPNCGHEMIANVPTSSTTIRKVKVYSSGDGYDTKATCKNCQKSISVYYG